MEIIGRVTKDATVQTVQDEKKVVNFSVAINDGYRTKGGETIKRTCFVNCDYWINTGVAVSLTKGTIVCLSGRMSVHAYTNMEGKAVGVLNFHVNQIRFVGGGTKKATPSTTEAPKEDTADDLPF